VVSVAFLTDLTVPMLVLTCVETSPYSDTPRCVILYQIQTKYIRAPVFTDSVSAVYRGPKKNRKIEEINGS
jgi:hypothetical protein